jgi:hypothetical protein
LYTKLSSRKSHHHALCLVAAKELKIKLDIFAATNSVNGVIARAVVNSFTVLAILTTWHHTFFEQLTKRLDTQFEHHMTRNAC